MKQTKKVLACMLALLLAISCLGTAAFAAQSTVQNELEEPASSNIILANVEFIPTSTESTDSNEVMPIATTSGTAYAGYGYGASLGYGSMTKEYPNGYNVDYNTSNSYAQITSDTTGGTTKFVSAVGRQAVVSSQANYMLGVHFGVTPEKPGVVTVYAQARLTTNGGSTWTTQSGTYVLTFKERKDTQESTDTIKVGQKDSATIEPTVDYVAGSNVRAVTASSSDSSIVKVDGTSTTDNSVTVNFEGLKAGTADITVTYTFDAILGPNLFGNNYTLDFTFTDIIHVTVEEDPTPTPPPTQEPTPVPTEEPTPVPTEEPTPTNEPDPTNSPAPTDEPTPTDAPTPTPGGESGGCGSGSCGENCGCTEENCTCEDCPRHKGGEEDPEPTANPQPDEKTAYPGMVKTADKESAGAGEEVTYTLKSTVPENLKEYLTMPEVKVDEPKTLAFAWGEEDGEYKLIIRDTWDEGLNYKEGSIEVKIGDTVLKYGLEEETEQDQYTFTLDESGNGFTLTLDLVDLYKKGIIKDSDLGVTDITVTYTVTVSEEITAGDYTNTAWVEFPAGTDEEPGESKKSSVTVKVYQIDIYKYDQDDESALGNAVFGLYSDPSCEEKYLLDTVTTDETGHISTKGLAAGTYYLKELEAPDGYVKNDGMLTIVIPDNADENNLVHVKFANAKVPHTGGAGVTAYTTGGLSLVLLAGLYLTLSKKREQSF